MGRRLGQHFLRDPGILDRIVAAIEPTGEDVVIEIGSGEGTLTARLLRRVGGVVAIERDTELAAALPERVSDARAEGRLRVVCGDALTVDWHRAAAALQPPGPLKVVGNIPYYITSPLIERALAPPLPAVIVFLVQREVADRIVASPGSRTFGALTVGVQAVARTERLFAVRAGAFRPPPRVDSAVVRLVPRPDPVVSEDERTAFRAFVVALFAQRRKQLGRGLRTIGGLSAEAAVAACHDAAIDPSGRPEALEVEQFARLFRVVAR